MLLSNTLIVTVTIIVTVAIVNGFISTTNTAGTSTTKYTAHRNFLRFDRPTYPFILPSQLVLLQKAPQITIFSSRLFTQNPIKRKSCSTSSTNDNDKNKRNEIQYIPMSEVYYRISNADNDYQCLSELDSLSLLMHSTVINNGTLQDFSGVLAKANVFDLSKVNIMFYESSTDNNNDNVIVLGHWLPIATKLNVCLSSNTKTNPLILKIKPVDQYPEYYRIASITFALDYKYVGSRDLVAFSERVEELFRWYSKTTERHKYIAPYFSFIQSSGTGKTRLMVEYRKQEIRNNQSKSKKQRAVLLIICSNYFPTELDNTYNDNLVIPETYIASYIYHQLDLLVSKVEPKGSEEIVFMFDEAHHLLIHNDEPFRCIRYWLRRKRGNNKKYVAVFTGTTTALANYFHDPPIHVGRSHEPQYNFYNTECSTMMYPPFYDLCTIGCTSENDCQKSEYDYENAISYGRPLFALMHYNDELEDRTHLILKRMLLSQLHPNWMTYQPALLSILATRVQMGPVLQASVVSELVCLGYANLNHFVNIDCDHQVAGYCYFTDPVCARLAMCLMDEDWEIGLRYEEYHGVNPKFWTQQALEIFTNGLCTPNNDQRTEIAAALYMLYCGDKLRKRTDPQYRTFGVFYNEWIELLKEPELKDPSSNNKETLVDSDKVSFVQFRRFHLRMPLKVMLTHKFLEHLYISGTGCYLYTGCPIFDLVVPIQRKDQKRIVTYDPLLISVKVLDNFSESTVCDIFQNFEKFIIGEVANARCMLLLLGGQHIDVSRTSTDNNRKLLFIQVPHNDPFGVTDLVFNSTHQT